MSGKADRNVEYDILSGKWVEKRTEMWNMIFYPENEWKSGQKSEIQKIHPEKTFITGQKLPESKFCLVMILKICFKESRICWRNYIRKTLMKYSQYWKKRSRQVKGVQKLIRKNLWIWKNTVFSA